jgi:RNA polymerase sigma-70 factor (ECF subfamily)
MQRVVGVRRGDGSEMVSFEARLEPLLRHGYRLACGMLHDPQAAEDAVQEAALKAWRKQQRLHEGAELRPWFLGIVANECRTLRRSRWLSVVKSISIEQGFDRAPDTVTAVDVRSALRRMDHGKRLVVVLRWYLDLPIREIALATGLSEHAVESRLRRAVHELRDRLGWEADDV